MKHVQNRLMTTKQKQEHLKRLSTLVKFLTTTTTPQTSRYVQNIEKADVAVIPISDFFLPKQTSFKKNSGNLVSVEITEARREAMSVII